MNEMSKEIVSKTSGLIKRQEELTNDLKSLAKHREWDEASQRDFDKAVSASEDALLALNFLVAGQPLPTGWHHA